MLKFYLQMLRDSYGFVWILQEAQSFLGMPQDA